MASELYDDLSVEQLQGALVLGKEPALFDYWREPDYRRLLAADLEESTAALTKNQPKLTNVLHVSAEQQVLSYGYPEHARYA